VYEFRAARFGNYYDNPFYAAERTREGVKYYYRLKFPNDENEWARPYRLSALHSRLQDLGAVFGEKFGWERVNYFRPGKSWRMMGADQRSWGWTKPPYFDLVGREHQATRERAALYDLSSFGKIEVSGTGALDLLQRLADNDLDRPTGSAVYTQFLNTRGGIEADITITRLAEDRFRVISGSSFIGNDLAWIRMHADSAGAPVEIRDVTLDWSCIALWGPLARQVLEKTCDSDLSNQAHPYLRAEEIDIHGVKVLAQRVSYVGELGWELYIPPERAVQVWDALVAAGREFELIAGGYKALDSLRLEKGYRYFTADITPLENPYAAGLGFCVRLDKGDFIGRQALLKVKEEGLKRKLCTLVLEDEAYVPLYGGEALYLDGKVISRVRSGGYGYTLQRNILYAYLPIELAQPGVRLNVDSFDRHVEAEVAAAVLFDPKGERVRS
jgi:4-methylaminobutanoate oxidase (formaldehyde-forming)